MPPTTTPTPVPPAPEPPRDRGRRTLIIVSGVVAILILIGLAYALLRTAAPGIVPALPAIPGITSSVGTTTGEVTYLTNRTPWQAMMDYFIQDVCLDKNGNVMMGVSPIDGNPNCVAHRDLLPGERLPYHKENPRSSGDTLRLDEIPVDTGTSVGVIAIKIKDNYGNDNGKKTGYLPNVLDLSDGVRSTGTVRLSASHLPAATLGEVSQMTSWVS
jgi:hypothetical protein